jgi:hypothetical protein
MAVDTNVPVKKMVRRLEGNIRKHAVVGDVAARD